MATFGRYEILERLAIGGMAEVFRARAWGAGGFSKDVVIKKILPGYSSDPEFRSLFIHEARISVGLTHSRITQVLDFGLMDGSYFIAMELVDGPDLGELLSALRKEFSRMPLPAAVHVLAEVLEGLDYAHRCTAPDGKPLEIVHRDISPHNVLVSRAGEVKLTDFGIARAAGSPSVTRIGRVRGKPQYMSPEQIRGQPLDGRSDLFSCGLLFYELLTGFPAYVGSDDGVLMNAILRGDLEPASARVKDVPRALDAVVERALHLDQDQRFSTASEFRQALLDVAYSYRIRPDSEVLGSLVRGHFARPKESRAAVVPSLVALTGEDGGLGRFSTSANSLQIPTADTADSVRGSKSTAGTATAESERGPSVMFPESSGESTAALSLPAAEPPPLEPTNVLPMREAPAAKPAVAPAARGALTLAMMVGLAVAVVGYLVVPLVVGSPGGSPRRADPTSTSTPAFTATPAVVLVPTPRVVETESLETPSPTAVPVRTAFVVATATPATVRTAIVVATPAPMPSRTTAAVAATSRPVAKSGTLSLNSRPWGEVTIDGRAIGPTPIVDHALAPGTYSVVITNAGAGVSERFSMTIEAGKSSRKFVELR